MYCNNGIAVRKVATPLQELACHMGSQSDPRRSDIGENRACTPSKAGTRFSDPGMQG